MKNSDPKDPALRCPLRGFKYAFPFAAVCWSGGVMERGLAIKGVLIARRGRFAHVSPGGYSIHCLVPPGEKENRACAVLLLGLILGGD